MSASCSARWHTRCFSWPHCAVDSIAKRSDPTGFVTEACRAGEPQAVQELLSHQLLLAC